MFNTMSNASDRPHLGGGRRNIGNGEAFFRAPYVESGMNFAPPEWRVAQPNAT